MSKSRTDKPSASRTLEWARKQRLGDAYAKIVLISLTELSNRAGNCSCSTQQFALDTAITARTIRKKLRQLEAVGLIDQVKGNIARGSGFALGFLLRLDLHVTSKPLNSRR